MTTSSPVKRFALIFVACVLCAACSKTPGRTTDNADPAYPFFITMPSELTIEDSYRRLEHTLSPLEQYHFRIIIPKDWKVLDAKLEQDVEPDSFDELAVFRQPGEWMTRETPADAEISISVIRPSDERESPAVWLQKILDKNVPTHEILQQRTKGEGANTSSDVLFKYRDAKEQYIMRMAAFRGRDRMYLVNCSDTINGYRDNAEACYVAINSFSLRSEPLADPFAEE